MLGGLPFLALSSYLSTVYFSLTKGNLALHYGARENEGQVTMLTGIKKNLE
jgi:hypothetical protein